MKSWTPETTPWISALHHTYNIKLHLRWIRCAIYRLRCARTNGYQNNSGYGINLTNTFFNFFKADYEGLVEHLGRVNWDILEIPSIDEATKKFYNVIYDALEIYVPRRRARSSTFPPWFDNCLISLTFKQIAHINYKNCQTDVNKMRAFMLLRAECKRASRICYFNYINRTENSISSDPKNFWKFVN